VMQSNISISADSVLCFIAMLLLPVQVTLIGKLYASEFVLLMLLPMLVARRGFVLLETKAFTVLSLSVMWLLGLIISDLIRETEFVDYSRGWAKVAFTIVNLAALLMLVKDKDDRMLVAFLGWGIGQGIVAITDPDVEGVTWKMGGGDAVTFAMLALNALMIKDTKFSRNIALFIFCIMIIISFAFDARNNAGRMMLAAIFIFVQPLIKPQFVDIAKFARSLMVVAAVGLPLSYGILSLYGALAKGGLLGTDAAEKFIKQSNTNFGPYGIMLGGRPEIFISTQAIGDSPLIGYGSWARSYYYYSKYFELGQLGFDISQVNLTNLDALLEAKEGEPYIPSHSIFFNSWIEGGFGAAAFWMYVLFLTIYALVVNIYSGFRPITPLAFHCFLLFIWDILFSPFGADRRLEVALSIVLVLLVLESARKIQGNAWKENEMKNATADSWRPISKSPNRRTT
jgi:hypothetical protein